MDKIIEKNVNKGEDIKQLGSDMGIGFYSNQILINELLSEENIMIIDPIGEMLGDI